MREGTDLQKDTETMQHHDFSIGLEFWCGGMHWRCTDVGSRVIVAISLEPHEMVRAGFDPDDRTRRTETRYVSTDPRDLDGPPYGVAESVFDEYDMGGCSLAPDDADKPASSVGGPTGGPAGATRTRLMPRP